jgi:ubiquinone/menaquinone biosynthesis C-methylase UbiE
LDIGGNTGKWAIASTSYSPDISITIMDLPGQLNVAKTKIEQLGLNDRVSFLPANILDESVKFPKGFDAIWMSQFLDCFSEQQIVSILRRAVRVMTAETTLHILELFWDRQPNETAAFCLQQTSLYFTCIANGNSQMYPSSDLKRCLAESGLRVVEERDQVGQYHTWLKCRKA